MSAKGDHVGRVRAVLIEMWIRERRFRKMTIKKDDNKEDDWIREQKVSTCSQLC